MKGETVTTVSAPFERGDHTGEVGPRSTGQWQWWSMLLLLVALAAVFLSVSAIGAAEAARDERVLPWLVPAATYLRTSGWQGLQWLLTKRIGLGCVISGTVALIALAGLTAGRLRALPLVLLGAALSLATWGQILLLSNQLRSGSALYGLGMVCALKKPSCAKGRRPAAAPARCRDLNVLLLREASGHWRPV